MESYYRIRVIHDSVIVRCLVQHSTNRDVVADCCNVQNDEKSDDEIIKMIFYADMSILCMESYNRIYAIPDSVVVRLVCSIQQTEMLLVLALAMFIMMKLLRCMIFNAGFSTIEILV